mmetsp:Transcript_9087/g.21103  ORF Transcript_9087/g.21103 Transcript_9087/m.21103 type:complete len:331 (+) Transcript_9087:135-1127(+)
MSSSCNRSQLAGMPMSPGVAAMKETAPVMVRYMFEGGSIGQGRLCYMKQRQSSETTIRASDVVDTLSNDGVDLDLFYPCAYESEMSSGGWLPMEPAPRHSNPWRNIDSNDLQEITFDIADADGVSVAKRIDVKLVRRPRMESRPGARVDDKPIDDGQIRAELEHCSEALHAISSAVPCGRLPLNGFFGIGVVSPKTQENIGTLWRSAFQLGASLLFTIAGRYRAASADTLNVPARIPLIELDDWSSFVQFAAPKACEWVVIEMGGTALKDFQHPRNAIYILGSEDHGVPKAILRDARHVVSLESEHYGSYNVAVAGSIVMYDRLIKSQNK